MLEGKISLLISNYVVQSKAYLIHQRWYFTIFLKLVCLFGQKIDNTVIFGLLISLYTFFFGFFFC